MDKRPIGVFDSGMGGLTAMRQLIKLLPGEDIFYFGDTGRVPYGTRSADTIIRYAKQDVAFLRGFSPKAILVACGTVSTTALSLLQAENDIPILGVVEPASSAAVSITKNGKIGIIGTEATIRTGAYETAVRRLNPQIMTESRACRLLVPMVEDGRVTERDTVTKMLIHEYLAPIKAAGVDTLIMGCTHYPLLTGLIQAEMGKNVTLIDTGLESARTLTAMLERSGMLNGRASGGARAYYASDSAADFASVASIFLGSDISGKVTRIDIERYGGTASEPGV